MLRIFPSLVSSDLLDLEQIILTLEPYSAGFHLDVADFHFAPTLSWSPEAINNIREKATKPLMIHLMVEYPEKYIPLLQLQPGDIISIHAESRSTFLQEELIDLIDSYSLIPSIAVSPTTPLETVIAYPRKLRHVLLLSVTPGTAGQPFLPGSLVRLKALSDFRKSHGLAFTIAVDGGITEHSIADLTRLGADQFAITSAIFKAAHPISQLQMLQTIIDSAS